MAGDAIFVIDANQGASPNGATEQIALTIGGVPQDNDDPLQYWIEYRHPSGFDRDIIRPNPGAAPDFPPEGILILCEVNNEMHSELLSWIGVRPGNVLRLPRVDCTVKIVDVNMAQRKIFLRLEKTPGIDLLEHPQHLHV